MNKIAQITDIHLDEDFPKEQGIDCRKNWLAILEDIKNRGIEEIIFSGDIGENISLDWFFESLNKNGLKYKVIIGNHDEYQVVINNYQNEYLNGHSELYYSFEDKNYKYIFMDSSTEKISQEQFKWFQNEVNGNKELVLFIHHPILNCNIIMDEKYPLQGREKLEDVLKNYEKNVHVFCGHYHLEDEREKSNVKQYITPAASFQVVKSPDEIIIDNSKFGYRIISFKEGNIDTEVVYFNQH